MNSKINYERKVKLQQICTYKYESPSTVFRATRISTNPLTRSSSIVFLKLCLAAIASPYEREKSPFITEAQTVNPLPVIITFVLSNNVIKIIFDNN